MLTNKSHNTYPDKNEQIINSIANGFFKCAMPTLAIGGILAYVGYLLASPALLFGGGVVVTGGSLATYAMFRFNAKPKEDDSLKPLESVSAGATNPGATNRP